MLSIDRSLNGDNPEIRLVDDAIENFEDRRSLPRGTVRQSVSRTVHDHSRYYSQPHPMFEKYDCKAPLQYILYATGNSMGLKGHDLWVTFSIAAAADDVKLCVRAIKTAGGWHFSLPDMQKSPATNHLGQIQ